MLWLALVAGGALFFASDIALLYLAQRAIADEHSPPRRDKAVH